MADIDPKVLIEMTVSSLHEGGSPYVTVTSNSMSPLILPGDKLQIVVSDIQALKPGDIIAVATGEGLLAHRFWNLVQDGDKERLLTKGDCLIEFDRPLDLGDFVGLINARRRDSRSMFLNRNPARWFNRLIFFTLRLEKRMTRGNSGYRDDDPIEQRARVRKVSSGLLGSGFHKIIYGLIKIISYVADITTQERI